jgi:C4-dicarboxylate-specific signal transduction histidine kinase
MIFKPPNICHYDFPSQPSRGADTSLPEVQIDGLKLQQVLLNLIRNAIDAMSSTPPDGRRLRLQSSFDGQSTVFMSVQDSGPGISTETRDRIFDPFFTTKPDGVGLGLAISSNLVEAAGGQLTLVKSESDGSIFELALPALAGTARLRR